MKVASLLITESQFLRKSRLADLHSSNPLPALLASTPHSTVQWRAVVSVAGEALRDVLYFKAVGEAFAKVGHQHLNLISGMCQNL